MTALAAVAGLRRRPALLLLGALSIPILLVVAVALVVVAGVDAVAAVIIIALAAGSALPVVALVAWLGGRAVSGPIAAAAVTWGAFAAPLLSVAASGPWSAVIAAVLAGEAGADWSSALAAGPVEETFKLLGLALLAVAWPGSVRGARAGLIAGMLVGLGFGTVEHVIHVSDAAAFRTDLGGPAETAAWVFLARAIAAGLYLHVAFTGLAGAALGWALEGSSRARWLAVVATVVTMAALHALGNAGPIRAPFLPWGPDDIGAVAIASAARSVPSLALVLLLARLRNEAPFRPEAPPDPSARSGR